MMFWRKWWGSAYRRRLRELEQLAAQKAEGAMGRHVLLSTRSGKKAMAEAMVARAQAGGKQVLIWDPKGVVEGDTEEWLAYLREGVRIDEWPRSSHNSKSNVRVSGGGGMGGSYDRRALQIMTDELEGLAAQLEFWADGNTKTTTQRAIATEQRNIAHQLRHIAKGGKAEDGR